MEFLRPVAWFEANGAAPGRSIDLHLPELGILGLAEVVSVGPCPPIRPGPGHVVTGTFAHEPSRGLIDVRLAGQSEPIGCTTNHPFWSEDRRVALPNGEGVGCHCWLAQQCCLR